MFKRIIKIPGKSSFSDLTIYEVSLMIEADSAIKPGGNELFDSCALDEFIHCSDLSARPDLEKIRDHIEQKIYLDVPGQRHKEINVEVLRHYAEELRAQANYAPQQVAQVRSGLRPPPDAA